MSEWSIRRYYDWWLQRVNSPEHTGGASDQLPVTRHVMFKSRDNLNPASHEKDAVLLIGTPEDEDITTLYVTSPFSKVWISVQNISVKRSNKNYDLLSIIKNLKSLLWLSFTLFNQCFNQFQSSYPNINNYIFPNGLDIANVMILSFPLKKRVPLHIAGSPLQVPFSWQVRVKSPPVWLNPVSHE